MDVCFGLVFNFVEVFLLKIFIYKFFNGYLNTLIQQEDGEVSQITGDQIMVK